MADERRARSMGEALSQQAQSSKQQPAAQGEQAQAVPAVAGASEVEVLRQVVNALVGAQAKDLERKQRSEREQEELRAEVAKPVWQRTQEAADRMFPEGPHVFEVCCPGDRVHIKALRIKAHSDHEAWGRYQQVCGIRTTAHTPSIAKVA